MGTLSKSFASCGGYIAGTAGRSRSTCATRHRAASCTAPASRRRTRRRRWRRSAKSLASRTGVKTLADNGRLFVSLAKAEALDTGPSADSPVVPVIVSNSMHCLKLADRLFKAGINVQPMLYPAVSEEASRLRFFITALHTPDQIRFTVARTGEACCARSAVSASDGAPGARPGAGQPLDADATGSWSSWRP